MKKLLLFLLLFGAGVSVLVWYVQKDAPKVEPRKQSTTQVPPDFTEIPVTPSKPGGQQGAVGVVLRGRTDFTVFSSDDPEHGKPLYDVHADDLNLVEANVYDAKNLSVVVHDVEKQRVRFELASPSTRLPIPLAQGKFSLGDGKAVEFSNASMTLHEGAPIVPLTLATPKLVWRLKEERLVDRIESTDRVEFDGKGFHAEGTGFDLDQDRGELVLTRDGLVRLDLEQGGKAVLRATGGGPIRVKRALTSAGMPDEDQELELVTTEGAKFEVKGEEPLVLDASTLRLHGRGGAKDLADFRLARIEALEDVVATSRGDTFRAHHAEFTFHAPSKAPSNETTAKHENRLERGVLDGNVVLESSGDVFRGDAATFHFDGAGQLTNAEISGSPSGEIVLGKYLGARPAPGELERKLQDAKARLSGTGPLVVTFAGDTGLELAGPGVLAVEEMQFVLRAGGQLKGSVRKDKKGGALDALGGVAVEYVDTRLTTEKLHLGLELLEPGKEAVVATTSGATTITGTPSGKGKVTLVADEGLEARTSQGRLSIPIARRVTLKAEGPDGFDASANRVNDLDWDTKEFVAEGAVHFNGAQGDGNAERAVVHGKDSVELYGVPGDPARWVLARRETKKGPFTAEARALEITAKGEEVHARGEVVCDLGAGAEHYELASGALDLVLDPLPPGVDASSATERTYHAKATNNVRATFTSLDRRGELQCQNLAVDGTARKTAEAARLGDSDLRAEGAVTVDWSPRAVAASPTGLRGSGDRFTLDRERRGRLESFEGRKVEARGTLGDAGQPYAMHATWIDFDEHHVDAADVVVGIDPGAGELPPGKPAVLQLTTKRFRADEKQIVLDGDAHATGRTGQGEGWTIDAGKLRITGDFRRETKLDDQAIELIEATGGFTAELADRARAVGDTLRGNAKQTRIEGSPARLELVARMGAMLESAWIQYDAENLLLATDRGRLVPVTADARDAWSVTYESLQPFARGENTILVLRNPRMRQGEKEVRALWALFWVDREEWRRRGEKAMKEKAQGSDLRVTEPELQPEDPRRDANKSPAERFADLRKHEIAKVLSEMYLEGNMEFSEAGERVARAASLYLDLKEGRGWAQDADIIRDIKIRGKSQRFRAKAQWMSIGPDLSLRADRAVLTSCEYDDPHYVIETHDLRMKPPRKGGSKSFYVAAKDNALRFGGSWAMPLPPLYAGSDENGYPFIGDLNFGNTARFGTALRSSFNLPLGSVGKGIGGLFNKFLDLPSVEIPDGRWKLDAGYLGSRGVLLGTGLEYVVREPLKDDPRGGRVLFHFDSSIDGIPDRQEDKGLVRVDPDDRSLLRSWFRARGRWAPTERRWWDLALSKQSDAGVQSEFFERDFLEYEQKDNYLHYRSTWSDWYLHASAKVLFEDRTDIEELPSAGLARGRTPIGHVGELPLYYTSQTTAGYLRRRDGDPLYFPAFPDGLGSRDVVRADTRQRLELPFDVGLANLRATPFVEGRFTAWDRGVDETQSPVRVGALAGVELGTTFWKRFSNGSLHAIEPQLSLWGDLGVEKTGGDPVRFDHVEDPIEGRFAELALRSRWWKPQSKEHLDIDLRQAYGTDLAAGQREGFQPVAVLGEFLTFAGSVPIGFTHDARYDLRENETEYSRTFVGFEPVHDWGLEFGYHLGRDDTHVVLYEAASFGTRYRATQKWELEFDMSYSLSDSRGLSNSFLLRRIGHDFIMETEVGYRAGEGASFNINLKPQFAWKRSSLGLIDRWLGVYH
ncbi:MAG: hypothetical protein HZA53_10125 [Planctomycetes bacterium]|nr:hypothetical protein [Planctomycetota bacterium]